VAIIDPVHKTRQRSTYPLWLDSGRFFRRLYNGQLLHVIR